MARCALNPPIPTPQAIFWRPQTPLLFFAPAPVRSEMGGGRLWRCLSRLRSPGFVGSRGKDSCVGSYLLCSNKVAWGRLPGLPGWQRAGSPLPPPPPRGDKACPLSILRAAKKVSFNDPKFGNRLSFEFCWFESGRGSFVFSCCGEEAGVYVPLGPVPLQSRCAAPKPRALSPPSSCRASRFAPLGLPAPFPRRHRQGQRRGEGRRGDLFLGWPHRFAAPFPLKWCLWLFHLFFLHAFDRGSCCCQTLALAGGVSSFLPLAKRGPRCATPIDDGYFSTVEGFHLSGNSSLLRHSITVGKMRFFKSCADIICSFRRNRMWC